MERRTRRWVGWTASTPLDSRNLQSVISFGMVSNSLFRGRNVTFICIPRLAVSSFLMGRVTGTGGGMSIKRGQVIYPCFNELMKLFIFFLAEMPFILLHQVSKKKESSQKIYLFKIFKVVIWNCLLHQKP